MGIDISVKHSPARRFTRSGVRRLGDEYQDVQSLDTLVEWLENNDRFEWLELEADDKGHLDDIVAKRSDGVVELRQIKFSTAPHKVDSLWTWARLLDTRDSKTSLLEKWYQTWERLRADASVEPFLRSNASAGPDLILQPATKKVKWDDIPESIKSKILNQLGSEAGAKSFFDVFTFHLAEPSLRELESGAYVRFLRLGGTPSGWNALNRAVRDWTNEKKNPPPNGRIASEDVWRAAKLNVHVKLRTFLPPVTFFAPYMDSERLFHHRLPQVGRKKELNGLLNFVSGTNQIAILPGRGGSGKTKLIYAFSRRLERVRPDLSVRLVTEGLPIEHTAREDLPDDSCLIIADDAHRVNGLEIVLAAARQNPKLKVLLVTRSHATDYLLVQAVSAGFDSEQILVYEPLSDLDYAREHRQLARRVLGDKWKSFADDLVAVTRDSPLLTVIGGQLLRTNQVPPEALSTNWKFRKEVLTRFRDVQLGEIVTKLDGRYSPSFCAKVLQVIAALSPINLGNSKLVSAMAELVGTREIELKAFIGLLVNAGVAVRGGRFVRIVPDVLSDFILQDACFAADGSITGFATQVYEKVAEFHGDAVLRNLAELDWRVNVAIEQDLLSGDLIPATGLLDSIWGDIQEKFKAASLPKRKAWLTRLERFAFLQPERVWPIVQIALKEPAVRQTNEESEKDSRYFDPPTQADVINASVPLLAGIARDDRFTARCADELWNIGRNVEVKSGHRPTALGVLAKLSSYEDRKSLRFSQIVLTCCRTWMIDPNIHTYRNSILMILSALLSRTTEWTSSSQPWRSHTIQKWTSESFRELRLSALKLVERCTLSDQTRIVLEAIRVLGITVSEEGLWAVKEENFSEWEAWEQEQLTSLEIIERTASAISDPFVVLRIWEACQWQAKRGPRSNVRARAREFLNGLSLSFESRLILLITGTPYSEEYSRTWNPNDQDVVDEHLLEEERDRRETDFRSQVLREWMTRYPDPKIGFDTFGEWIERIERSGWWNEIWTRSNPFLLQLATDYPQYAEQWCEIAVENPDVRTSRCCADLLCEIRRRNQEKALQLVRRFLGTGHPNLWLGAAASYSWRCWPKEPLPDEMKVLRELLAFDNIHVKRAAAQTLVSVASTDCRSAVDILLEVEIGKDTKLAEKLFQIFGDRGGVDCNELERFVLLALLKKLDEVESVRNYHVGSFLVQAALREPIAVAQLLLRRIRTKVQLSQERWEKPAPNMRSFLAQMNDTFGGLPRSAFQNEEFSKIQEHPEYLQALRLVRDAALDDYYSAAFLYEDTLSELFYEFSLNFCQQSLEVLNEWINSGDCQKVTAALELLEYAQLGFFVNHLPFVSNYLHQAYTCGSQVFERVEQTLLIYATNGPPRGIASHRGERSNALFHKANQALEALTDDPLTERFFEQLRKTGRNMIQSELHEVEEEEVFYRG